MKIIDASSLMNVDISALAEVYSYIVTETLLVAIDVVLDGINGDADYDFQFFNNGAMVLPSRTIPVPAGVTKANIQSRSLIVRANSLLTLKVLGHNLDTAVNLDISIINISPIESEDVLTIIEPGISEAIVEGLSNTEIRPTRTVLGPCRLEYCEDEE